MLDYLVYFAVMIGVQFLNPLLHGQLNILGIRPHETTLLGAIGIVGHPFLHLGLNHLIANSFGYIPLGFLVVLQEEQGFRKIFWAIAIFEGVAYWLTARAGVIGAGASGVIFGFMGFLIANAILQKNFLSIACCAAAVVISGKMIFGMLPWFVPGYVSWQGHLFGFIGGIAMAYYLRNRR